MNPRLSRISIAIILALVTGGYASAGDLRVPVTPMGVREVQTRTFDNVDPHTAMKAAIDMLQDGGFNIEHTDADLGLVIGRQSVVRRPSGGLRALKYVGAAFSYGLIGLIPLNKTDELEASVNVTGVDETSVRVRIVIQRRMLDKNGRLKKTEALTSGPVYQDLFELLGRSLFVSEAQ
ncbi:MAG TPA: hypothetical protein PLD86_08100 [Vicinamibacteria bacterium]|nr:hypothetical protein [Vicinamibacteria bacterium]